MKVLKTIFGEKSKYKNSDSQFSFLQALEFDKLKIGYKTNKTGLI